MCVWKQPPSLSLTVGPLLPPKAIQYTHSECGEERAKKREYTCRHVSLPPPSVKTPVSTLVYVVHPASLPFPLSLSLFISSCMFLFSPPPSSSCSEKIICHATGERERDSFLFFLSLLPLSPSSSSDALYSPSSPNALERRRPGGRCRDCRCCAKCTRNHRTNTV